MTVESWEMLMHVWQDVMPGGQGRQAIVTDL